MHVIYPSQEGIVPVTGSELFLKSDDPISLPAIQVHICEETSGGQFELQRLHFIIL